jgi:hypothetical protein
VVAEGLLRASTVWVWLANAICWADIMGLII